MVSFWPWKKDTTSAESFEKTLSVIATKISKATAQNDSLRQRARKLKVGWILYGGVTYILAFLILTLVTGWQNWGTTEYTTIAGGPVLLYGVRFLLNSWYNYRTSNSQAYLDSLQKERDETIEKLKQATKYNSTQKLLEKYGSAKAPEKTPDGKSQPARNHTSRHSVGGRTGLPPPPTANIPRAQSAQRIPELGALPALPPSSPLQPSSMSNSSGPGQALLKRSQPQEEFAPNAFDGSPTVPDFSQVMPESHWYDRILDALLGEDETQARNRLALVCKHCKVVNGLAPPGVKTPEQLGKWRCSSCSGWNGEEFDAAKLVKDATKHHSRNPSEAVSGAGIPSPDLLGSNDRPRSTSVESSMEAYSAEE
ncbi:hypothetical protein BT63DRAFT_172506 [Microthyrium microscopicum]|uniref:Endoplasmic reticulum junction formation protein lunapark n=1 Tax=Microthyrium microscopicum TaxID=703497 RepID=A0A6A6UNV3_9PEZI|nr:hypothetical protein BT63DRAFT_172506 [Microthyrium microscopicum]